MTYDWGMVRGLGEFLAGAGLAVLFRAVDHQRIPVWVHSAAQMLLLVILAYSVSFTGWSHGFNDIYTVLPIMGLVFALAFDKGVLAEALKTRPLQKIGDWSYAIYIGQTAWLLVIRFFSNAIYPPDDTPVWGTTFQSLMWWLEPALLMLVCLAWGAALAEWVEKPAARFLRRRLGRRLDPKSIPTPS
jgi:peptidoglycan/LPS O-acetylase OafA/YrhL